MEVVLPATKHLLPNRAFKQSEQPEFDMNITLDQPTRTIKRQVHKLFFLMIFTFSGACNGGENSYKVETIENRYNIAICSTMEREMNHSPALARLYIDREKGELVAVTDHLKEGGVTQLASQLKILKDDPSLMGLQLKEPQFGDPIKKQINNHNALQTEVRATMKLDGKWRKVWGILAYVEGKTHIYQITTWLIDNDPGEDDTRLHQIINSFEEIKEEEY